LNLDVWPTKNDIKIIDHLSKRTEFQYLKSKLKSYLKLQ
jgi:hypothetical protein